MKGVRQTIALIITFKTSNKNSLDSWMGTYQVAKKNTLCKVV